MKRIYLALCIAMLASCVTKTQVANPPIALVSDIISDSGLPAHGMVASFKAKDPEKSLYIIGPSDLNSSLLSEFLHCDRFDNVDGRMASDGLPDFSGEIICTINDFANEPYPEKGERLRRITVEDVLAAMDTVCYINELDHSGLASKPLPKVLVLSSPYSSEFGKYDADSLFSALGCSLPIISPLRVMMDGVLAGRKSNVCIGVITMEENLKSEAYGQYLQQQCIKKGLINSECVVFKADAGAVDPLLGFLDNYLSAGCFRPLDAILVDDPSVDAEAMRTTLKRITRADNEESLSYGKLISTGCTVQDAAGAVSSEVFRYLRKNNLFTHEIAWPRSIEFKTVTMADSSFVLTQHKGGDPLL